MGLRPSVKNDGGGGHANNDGSNNETHQSLHSQNSKVSSNNVNNVGKLPPPKPPLPQREEAWTARGKLLQNFYHVISRALNSPEMLQKCSQIAPSMNENENNDNGKSFAGEYSAEAALIVENKSRRDAEVRNKSVALGLMTFVSLRGFPWARRGVVNYLKNNMNRNGYRFDKLPTSSSGSGAIMSQMRNNASINNGNQQPRSLLRRSFRFAFDLTISTSVTFLSGTFLFMPRPSAYIDDMAKLPLVEGKSVYAEMVCPPLIKEYKRVLEQYGGRWPVRQSQKSKKAGDDTGAGEELTQEDVSLNVIRKFVENCSKRSKYEQALMNEREAFSGIDGQNGSGIDLLKRLTKNSSQTNDGKSVNNIPPSDIQLGTLAVPSPGVPEDLAINVDQEVLLSDIIADGDEENEEGRVH